MNHRKFLHANIPSGYSKCTHILYVYLLYFFGVKYSIPPPPVLRDFCQKGSALRGNFPNKINPRHIRGRLPWLYPLHRV